MTGNVGDSVHETERAQDERSGRPSTVALETKSARLEEELGVVRGTLATTDAHVQSLREELRVAGDTIENQAEALQSAVQGRDEAQALLFAAQAELNSKGDLEKQADDLRRTLTEQLDQANRRLTAESERAGHLQAMLEEARGERDHYIEQHNEWRGRATAAEKELKRLAGELRETQEAAAGALETAESYRVEAAQLKKDVEGLRKDLEFKAEDFERLRQENVLFVQLADAAKVELAKREKQLSTARKRARQVEGTMTVKGKEMVIKRKQQVADLQAQVKELKGTVTNLKKTVRTLSRGKSPTPSKRHLTRRK